MRREEGHVARSVRGGTTREKKVDRTQDGKMQAEET